jgi:hypothetical protein
MPSVVASRVTPRISVNKLGEYMEASAGRRERIIQDQKNRPAFQVARYQEAQDAITDYLLRGARDESIITMAIERLDSAAPTTEWDEQRKKDCIGALESILSFDEFPFLDNMLIVRGTLNPSKLAIAGVQVSVRPEIILRQTRSGGQVVGGVKLCLAKTMPLSDASASYIGTVLHQYVEQKVPGGSSAQFKNCVVLDVFAKAFYLAPRACTRRRQDVAAACREIARMWPSA